jgi:hypothetical protein
VCYGVREVGWRENFTGMYRHCSELPLAPARPTIRDSTDTSQYLMLSGVKACG